MRLNYAWQAERLLLLSFSQPVTGATNHVDLPIIPHTTLHPQPPTPSQHDGCSFCWPLPIDDNVWAALAALNEFICYAWRSLNWRSCQDTEHIEREEAKEAE